MKTIQANIKALKAKVDALTKLQDLTENTLCNIEEYSYYDINCFLSVIERLEASIIGDGVDLMDLAGFFESSMNPGPILDSVNRYITDHWDF